MVIVLLAVIWMLANSCVSLKGARVSCGRVCVVGRKHAG
jgi:hypothetical protein